MYLFLSKHPECVKLIKDKINFLQSKSQAFFNSDNTFEIAESVIPKSNVINAIEATKVVKPLLIIPEDFKPGTKKPIAQIYEETGFLPKLLRDDLEKYGFLNGGCITELGKKYLEHKYGNTVGHFYLAVDESLAELIHTKHILELMEKYPNLYA